MRLTHLCAATAATAVLACAGAVTPALAAPSPAGSDATFLVAIHQANLAEIAAGEDALAHANNACVKSVAEILIRDHTKLDTQAAALARSKGVLLPKAPSTTQQRQLNLIKDKSGTAAYDPTWLNAQAVGHTEVLKLIDTETSSGADAQVRDAARAARPIIAMHLQMVEGGTCHAPATMR